MPYLVLTEANLKLVKDHIRGTYKVPSSHFSEAIAAALGFRSYAALKQHLKALDGAPETRPLSDDLFVERLDSLGSPLNGWRGFASFRSAAIETDQAPGVKFSSAGPFRMVYNLWITPDFASVLAGKAMPPFVDHNHVDFEYLRSVLADEFRFGSPVEIRLANDTIDQVTVHLRQPTGDVALIKCVDFAKLLLQEARTQASSIIDVRRKWAPLHGVTNRRHAPPPILLPIVIEAYDAEDALLWGQHAGMRLGVKACNPEYFMFPPEEKNADDHQGHLTTRLHKVLKKSFNTPYEPYCLIDRVASDPMPPEFAHIEHLR